MDKRTNSGELEYQPYLKIRKMEPPVFPLKGAKDLSEHCLHRCDYVRCIIENAVYVGKSPLHANKINDYVAAQAPLYEDQSMFWKAIYDGDYMIVDLTTEKDRRKFVRAYYPETLNEDYPLDSHVVRLIEDRGALKKYSVQDLQTKKVKEVWRFYANWPEHEKVSVEKLAGFVEIMANNKVWVHCRDGASRAGVVVAAALLKKKIASGKIHEGNFVASLDKLVDKVRNQRLKSIPHEEQVDLLWEYGKSLLGIAAQREEKKETFVPISMVIEEKKPNYNGLKVDQLWACLISQNPVYGHFFGQVKVFNHDEFPHRFTNISCIKETAVHVNGEPFHANTVVMNGCKKRFVASQAPLPEDIDKFWQAVTENNYVIFDLTNENDSTDNYCSRKGVKFTNEMGPWTYYKVNKKDVIRFHFSNWPDFQGNTVQQLAWLVNSTKNYANFWVHCNAGVGRAGTFIAACFLQEKIFSGEIRKDNYHEALVALILEIRKQRAHAVQNLKQFTLLYEYGEYLLHGNL